MLTRIRDNFILLVIGLATVLALIVPEAGQAMKPPSRHW